MHQHRGFVAHRSRNIIRWVVIPPFLVMLVALWMVVRALHPPMALHTMSTAAEPAVHLYRTSLTWSGDPVLCVTNGSTTSLDGVSIQNWANQSLAIYAAGPSTFSHLPVKKQRFPVPPVDVPPGECVWFVGSTDANTPYTLYCTMNQKPFYVTLDAKRAQG